MNDWNQGADQPDAPASPPPAETTAAPPPAETAAAPPPAETAAGPPQLAEAAAAPPQLAETAAGPPQPPFPQGALYGALGLALLGGAAVLLGQVEAGALVALAVLFLVAQAADGHRGFVPVHWLLAWIIPVCGAATLTGLATLLLRTPHTPLRGGSAAFALVGAVATLATILPPVADALARALLRGGPPGHVSRLAARAVLATVWVCLTAWVALRDEIPDLLRDPAKLVDAARLGGSLLGYVVLAFAAVGWGVRRDLRATLERLGLAAPRLADLIWIVLGVAALAAFNAGSESFERSFFPALWRVDQRFTESIAGAMGPAQMVLLGLSAGIGEEITLRGALQPRLGLWATAVLFALMHVQYTWFGIACIAVFGVILGAIRLRRGTTTAILVHALYDLLAVAAAATATTGRG